MQLQTNVHSNRGWGRKTLRGTLVTVLVFMAGIAWNHIEAPRSLAYSAFRELSRFGIGLQTRGWESMKGSHFEIRYQPEDVDMASIVLNTAEEAVEPVNARLGYAPQGRMLVLVYPTREALGKSFGWAADQSAMGVYWAGTIRVLSPAAWIESGPQYQVAQEFRTTGPMVHEYTHLVVDYISRGNYPRWFTEGVAQYIERDFTGFMLSDQVIGSEEEWFSLNELDRNFDTPLGQPKAYRQSLAMIDYLGQEYGEDAFVRILHRLGQGVSFETAWKDETGVSLEQFEDSFGVWTQSQVACSTL